MSGAVALTLGGYHTCVLMMGGGGVKCWGRGGFGSLGNGSTATQYSPVDVSLLVGTCLSIQGVVLKSACQRVSLSPSV